MFATGIEGLFEETRRRASATVITLLHAMGGCPTNAIWMHVDIVSPLHMYAREIRFANIQRQTVRKCCDGVANVGCEDTKPYNSDIIRSHHTSFNFLPRFAVTSQNVFAYVH